MTGGNTRSQEGNATNRWQKRFFTVATVAMAIVVLTTLTIAVETRQARSASLAEKPTMRRLLAGNDADDEAIESLIALKRKYPRRNFAGDTVSNEFNPTDKDYQESMVLIGMPGFVLSVLFLLVAVIFFSLRCCCGRCGGKKTRLQRLYTRKQRVGLMISLTFVGAVTAVAAILGLVGNSQFSKGLTEFTDSMSQGVDFVVQEIELVVTTLDSLNGQPLPRGNLGTTQGTIQDTIAETNKEVQKIDNGRLVVVSFALVVAILAMVLGMCSAVFRKGILSTLMLIFAFIVLFTTWLAFGFHFPVSVMVADLCDAIGKFLESGTSTEYGIGTFFTCIPASNYAPQLQRGHEGLLTTCNNIEDMVRNRRDIGTYDFNVTSQYYELVTIGPQLTQLDQQIQDFKQRGIGLPPDLERETIRGLGYFRVLDTLDSIQQCTRVRQAYQGIHYQLCFKALKGLDLVLVASALVGVFFIPACVIAFLGSRWFKKPKELKQRAPTSDDTEARAAFAEADAEEMREFDERNQSATLSPDQWNKV